MTFFYIKNYNQVSKEVDNMSSFINDFKLFFNVIFECLTEIFNWLTSTIIGEIIFFVIIMSAFVGFIVMIVHMKD